MQFTIDSAEDDAPRLKGKLDGYWNGWAVPKVTAEDFIAWAEDFAAWCGDPVEAWVEGGPKDPMPPLHGDGVLRFHSDGVPADEGDYWLPLMDGTYRLDGWVWVTVDALIILSIDHPDQYVASLHRSRDAALDVLADWAVGLTAAEKVDVDALRHESDWALIEWLQDQGCETNITAVALPD